MKEIVFIGENNQALTNSLLVAEKFGKEPNDVVRAIDNLLQNADNECSAKVQNMFVEYTEDVPQPNGGVKTAKRFIMNRDGFTLLAMGFTGKRVLKFKLEYIAAFNEMEKMINGGGYARIADLEQRVCAIEQRAGTRPALALPITLPAMSQRDTIRMMVNECSSKMNVSQRDIWRKVYDQLYYRYHVSVRAYKRKRPDETVLEVAERHGQLPRIYAIVSNMMALFR
jgi:phage regulatory protein, rha family